MPAQSEERMRRMGLIGAVVFLLGAMSVSAAGAPEAETTGFLSGTVVYLEGDVSVNGIAADFGTTVRSGDSVRTGTHSSCDIVFGEKNIMRLYEETLATIDFALGDVSVDSGSMGVVFDKLANVVAAHGNKFQVRSPHVAAGVRGTVFYLKIEDESSSYLCICNGRMVYEDREGDRRTAAATNHKAYRYREVGGEIRSTLAPLLYHDDDSMDEIAEQIEVDIEWGRSGGSY